MLGAWSLTHAAGQGNMAPASPAPKFGTSLDSVAAADPPRGLPALPAAIRTHADALFTDAGEVGETRALLVLRDGELIYERYGAGFGPQSKLISWSMAKSITAVLIGFLVADGQLSLDGPAPVGAWQRSGDPRGAITLRNLLHMSSGLEHVENGDPVWQGDTVAMLFGGGAEDMAGFAETKPAAAQPGEALYHMEKDEDLHWGSVFIDFDCNADGDSLRRIADGEADPSCQVQTNAKFNTVRNFTHYIRPGDSLIPTDNPQTTAALQAAPADVANIVTQEPQAARARASMA